MNAMATIAPTNRKQSVARLASIRFCIANVSRVCSDSVIILWQGKLVKHFLTFFCFYLCYRVGQFGAFLGRELAIVIR